MRHPIIHTWQHAAQSLSRLKHDTVNPFRDEASGVDCVVLVPNAVDGLIVYGVVRILSPVVTIPKNMGTRWYDDGEEVVLVQRGTLTATLSNDGDLRDFATWDSSSITELGVPEYVRADTVGLASTQQMKAVCVPLRELDNFELRHLPAFLRVAA